MIIELSDYFDGRGDASEAILRALGDAKRMKADGLHIPAGVYELKAPIRHETDQSAHDAGAVQTGFKEVLILLEGFSDFTLCGDIGENGEPSTILAGMNTLELQSMQPSILWCENCRNLTVKNLKFTRAPEFASAGRIEAVRDNRILVRVSEGNPCYDGMGTYCMNRFTPDGKRLNGESLSYGPGLNTTFRLVGERLLELESEKIAGRVEVGDMISWHQGSKTDFQCFFGEIDRLTLCNLRTANANGFAMIAFDVHNLTAERVVFKPEGNQLFCAPRDAWKLHKCSGKIEISGFYVEGVRMDGQNVHNNYLFVKRRLCESELLLEAENARTDFRIGSDIEFFRRESLIGKARLKSYEHISSLTEGGRNLQIYKFSFDEPLGFEADEDTLALAGCFSPESYNCRDSEFRNVAGAGHLLRASHVHIERCRYTNMMNPGILLGAEFPTHHEGGNCEDIRIDDCEFDNCGFVARYGTIGCIGINSAGFETAVNHDIVITGCRFCNSAVGVDIHTARRVKISGCTYENIGSEAVLN